MNDLAHVDDLVEHQDKGADLTIRHPVTGEPLDIVLTIAGPDSGVARRARLQFDDELYAFSGRPRADELDRMHVDRLARLVVGWRVTRNGALVKFTHTNVVKLLRSAEFIRAQVDAFSQRRDAYFMRTL